MLFLVVCYSTISWVWIFLEIYGQPNCQICDGQQPNLKVFGCNNFGGSSSSSSTPSINKWPMHEFLVVATLERDGKRKTFLMICTTYVTHHVFFVCCFFFWGGGGRGIVFPGHIKVNFIVNIWWLQTKDSLNVDKARMLSSLYCYGLFQDCWESNIVPPLILTSYSTWENTLFF